MEGGLLGEGGRVDRVEVAGAIEGELALRAPGRAAPAEGLRAWAGRGAPKFGALLRDPRSPS